MLLLVTIVIKEKLKNKKSFPRINPAAPPIKPKIVIILNHFCPAFNSSFVFLARKFPMKNPRIKMPIPISNWYNSCIMQNPLS